MGRVFLFLRAFSAAFTVIILVVMFTPLANRLAGVLVIEPELEKADVIVVLGGGAYNQEALGGASSERLIRGLLLYKKGYASKILFAGGTIAGTASKIIHTLMGSEGTVRFDAVEAAMMGQIALDIGVPEDDVIIDAESTHTYGNLVVVKRIMDERGLKKCLLVTSPTHMYRSMRVAERLGLDCIPAPVEDYTRDVRLSTERLALMRAVLWEFAGLALYRIYGYI